MREKFLFQKEDYDDFCVKITGVEKRVKEITASIGGVVDSSGDQWHDNLLYDAQNMSEAWSRELSRLLDIQADAEIIDFFPPRDGKIRFGKTFIVLNINTGETFSYEISSYFISTGREWNGEIKRISYSSPLGKLFIGAEVDDIREEKDGENRRKFKIIRIDE